MTKPTQSSVPHAIYSVSTFAAGETWAITSLASATFETSYRTEKQENSCERFSQTSTLSQTKKKTEGRGSDTPGSIVSILYDRMP